MPKTIMQTNSNDNCGAECPICHGTGWEIIDDGGHGVAVECSCGIRQKRIAENRLTFASLPDAFRSVSIDSYKPEIFQGEKSRNTAQTAVRGVRWWLSDFASMQERGMGLYLYSTSKGSGKTMMAAGIANALIERGVQVKFTTSLQLLEKIKDSWDKQKREDGEGQLLEMLSNIEVLIIDDFGVEDGERQWIKEKYYHIFNSRYINKKITILTSNSRLDCVKCDERITNRLKERTYQLPFPEESVRDIIAKRNMEELISNIKKM